MPSSATSRRAPSARASCTAESTHDLEQARHVVRRGQGRAEALAELLDAPALGVQLVDALLELARHVVEDRAELRELVVAPHGQALVEAPGRDGADAVGERLQRVGQRAHRERRADADEHEQEAHEERDAQPDRVRVRVEQALRVERDDRGRAGLPTCRAAER